jgi:hypothetical protein
MSDIRMFSVGDSIAWDFRPYDSWLRSMIESGAAPKHPVIVEILPYPQNQCPICGSTDLSLKHFSWRTDGSPDGCEWDGTFPHLQILVLQDGSRWTGDWFTKV